MILGYKSSDKLLVFTRKMPKYKSDSLTLKSTFFLQRMFKYIILSLVLFGMNAYIWLQYKDTMNYILPATDNKKIVITS